MAGHPRIAVVLTGGTMDAVGIDRLDVAAYFETHQRLADGELISGVPELATVADIVEVAYAGLSSTAIGPDDWLRLAARIAQLQADPAIDGVVITHGTNTIEETAYFLSLVLGRTVPVVLVGAMRPASALSPDGPRNLLDAVRAAATPDLATAGPVVLLNGDVLAAREATKRNTYRTDAFEAVEGGPIAHVDPDGRVRQHQAAGGWASDTASTPQFAVDGSTVLPRVDVVLSYAGQDGTAIDAAVRAGAAGIVSAGFGAGLTGPEERRALETAVGAGVVVVQSSRVGAGRVVPRRSLRDVGIVAGGDLLPWKARILLMLALLEPRDHADLQELFDPS